MSENIEISYFPHDTDCQLNKKLRKVIRDLGVEGYGLYWLIVEFLHKNELEVGEEDLVFDTSSAEKIRTILNNYGLFSIENNQYYSERIRENIKTIIEKSKKAKNSANKRWIKKFFIDVYEEIFKITPKLHKEEIETLNLLADEFEDFKEILPNVIYTLHSVKFDNGIKPGCDWLLAKGKNNFHKIYNRQFGWKIYKNEEKKAQEERQKELIKKEEEKEDREKINQFKMQFKTKEDVYEYFNKKDIRFMSPIEKDVLNDYGISIDELKEVKNEKKIS